MKPTVILIHGGKSTGAKLQALLPEARVVVIYREGLSSGYNEVTGLAHQYPTLPALLAAFAPDHALAPSGQGDPLVLLAFSAGGWALRYYLRNEAARQATLGAVFLDSTYGKDLSPWQGVLAFAKLANAEPVHHHLTMTWSQAHPEPGTNAQAIAKAAGPGDGITLRPYLNANHGEQQSIAGPAAVEALVPLVRADGGGKPGGGGVLLALLAFLGLAKEL